MKAETIPGFTRSDGPDDIGFTALAFVTAVRDDNYARVWGLLTKESRGLAAGYWIASRRRLLRDVYEIARSTSHPEFDALFSDFCEGLRVDWGAENLEQLAVAPTKFLDERRALIRLAIGVSEPTLYEKPTAIPAVLVPMLLEDREWKFHLPGTVWVDE